MYSTRGITLIIQVALVPLLIEQSLYRNLVWNAFDVIRLIFPEEGSWFF